MKMQDVVKRIPLWYKAAIDERFPDRIRCFYLRSAPGRGKSTAMVEAPTSIKALLGMDIGIAVLSGPLLTPADGVGYLVPKHVDGRAESVFTDPFWFRTQEGKRLEEYEGGIVVVEEIDKADVDVKKVIGEAALSGRLGPHKMPKNWVVWMNGNRQQDRSGGTKELDHLINRRCEIDITDDVDGWADWAVTRNVSPVTIAFAKSNPNIVFSQDVPEKQGPWCTPRSLCMVDGYLQSLAGLDGTFPDDATTVEEASGTIGAGAAAQFFATIRLEREMPKFEEIVKAPKTVKVPTKADAQMLVCYNLAHRVSKDTAVPVVEYMERFPKEFSVTFATAACKRMPSLVMTPAFQKWAMQNSSLMAAIAR